MLCYHAWCHDSHLLPIELQHEYDLIDFGSKMLVQYFDSILYRVMTLVTQTAVKFTHNCTTAGVITTLVS
jgi:hypothetical protein